jgi:serpin B
LTTETRLVLTNAIYFKGNWASQFKKDATKKAPFFTKPGQKLEVDMMWQLKNFRYGEDKGLKILQLPYKANELSMLVILPNKIDGLSDVEKTLTAEKVSKWISSMNNEEVRVFLPKFKMTRSFSLKEKLVQLGMGGAFGDKANFSGMNGLKNLFISAVIHKAFVDVNEEGTEAAAATAVVMEGTTCERISREIIFKADHPFIFMIIDNGSGSILFMGRLDNPKS